MLTHDMFLNLVPLSGHLNFQLSTFLDAFNPNMPRVSIEGTHTFSSQNICVLTLKAY